MAFHARVVGAICGENFEKSVELVASDAFSCSLFLVIAVQQLSLTEKCIRRSTLPLSNSTGVTGPEVMKLFTCSIQLSMKFIMLINLKCLKIKTFLAFRRSDVVFIMLINIKLPTIVGILTFISRLNFELG